MLVNITRPDFRSMSRDEILTAGSAEESWTVRGVTVITFAGIAAKGEIWAGMGAYRPKASIYVREGNEGFYTWRHLDEVKDLADGIDRCAVLYVRGVGAHYQIRASRSVFCEYLAVDLSGERPCFDYGDTLRDAMANGNAPRSLQ